MRPQQHQSADPGEECEVCGSVDAKPYLFDADEFDLSGTSGRISYRCRKHYDVEILERKL